MARSPSVSPCSSRVPWSSWRDCVSPPASTPDLRGLTRAPVESRFPTRKGSALPIIDRFSNIGEGRRRKELEQLAQLVNTWEPEIEDLSDEELAHKTVEFRQRVENGEPLDDILPEAFATTREA